eukprot:4865116-Ditylum_brightwellii.AAC.1
MSRIHGANPAGTNGNTSYFHKEIQPTRRQRTTRGIHRKKGGNNKGKQENKKEIEVPMECLQPSKLLAAEATNTTGAKT